MIDIKELKEKLKSPYVGYGKNADELLIAYNEEQRDLVKNAIDELERLQKREITSKVVFSSVIGFYCGVCGSTAVKTPYGDDNKYCGSCGCELNWGDYK